MNVLKGFCLAFTTYSRIPMIHVYPNKENMRYLLCYFPLVGAAIGGLLMLWYWICLNLGINNMCFAAVAAVLPVLITGGIHTDGFMDTRDALSSWGSKQRKQEILNDPHVGAFAVISVVVYYVIMFGFFCEVTIYGQVGMIGLAYVISRALCGMEIALMRPAKNTGMLYELSSATNKAAAIIVNIIFLGVCAFLMTMISPYISFFLFIAIILLTMYYKFFVAKRMGGISGDTCGYFIQMCEIVTIVVIIMGEKVAPLISHLLTPILTIIPLT